MKVLFICLGNVARSQMAEGFYNTLTHSSDATSAGCNPTTHLHYQHPVQEVIEMMKEEGIDVSQNQVKFVTKEMADKADKIYVLNRKEECPDFIANSPKSEFWNIEDPFGESIEKFRRIRDEIKERVEETINSDK